MTAKLVTFIAITGLLTNNAYAYLDPGTGSMILQGILGAVAIGAASVSVFWHRVKSVFTQSSRDSETSSDNDDDKR
ncbi:hypothetical protein [Nitratireductor sp. StC3]|uniref:hypothetical protein n=1 Tax=Nitratireductor sp. StC3 TaxID=2126741 RepID=UPI000D0CC2A4|nr:hypothetical protein [Nitratireductor sp. StC3]PSM20286.1 hypothetical protein C7T96_04395 [Nitratireductor sp. StC3]